MTTDRYIILKEKKKVTTNKTVFVKDLLQGKVASSSKDKTGKSQQEMEKLLLFEVFLIPGGPQGQLVMERPRRPLACRAEDRKVGVKGPSQWRSSSKAVLCALFDEGCDKHRIECCQVQG